MKIITDNKYRYISYFCELDPKVQSEFDYLDPNNDNDASREFVKYKGYWYDLSDFMRVSNECFKGWDGYRSDSFFSGVLVKYNDFDSEVVMLATYYS